MESRQIDGFLPSTVGKRAVHRLDFLININVSSKNGGGPDVTTIYL